MTSTFILQKIYKFAVWKHINLGLMSEFSQFYTLGHIKFTDVFYGVVE